MATILLQAAGGALGGMIGGPFGAVAGRALGALGGYSIDNRLLAGSTRREGARLSVNRVMETDEGAGVARVYGTARLAGQVIWTTRFEEVSNTERQGGKGGGGGGTTTTSYSYFGNVAVGLCEGPIACVRRIWADGEELDLAAIQWRLHRGDEEQRPDPLIEAKQGAGRAPAYRGLAYLVFERLSLERWGNRIPQISCEVVRPVGEFENRIRAITIIPGATEHGLDPRVVRERVGPGEDRLVNRNMLHGASDFSASLEELTALCPSLERAALVVAWFADDLRAGRAECRPGVEARERDETEEWRVGPTGRGDARLISQIDGGPAYGGTPSDAGVRRSIEALRTKGLKVTFYPFLLMDVPPGNGLPDPHGAGEQAPFPWRGRMSLDLAETQDGSADRSSWARADVGRFVGSASPAHFNIDGGIVRYAGPAEWSYRRMILHQAYLARSAGGVDAFVIGSEMRGLTRLRDGDGRFPFVEELIDLARDVKAILPQAIVTYAADWSEYFGYQPTDGSGDVFYNLDPLWADPAIGAVGIDNYLPLTDWRDEDGEEGQRDGFASPYDRERLVEGVAGGEYADWFYPNGDARFRRERSAITDGLGKPWVFRAKDLRSWWSNPHHDRRGGVEVAAASPWVPTSKPIWFTELGCPAIDRGANQPNVFVDPKSAESAFPYFSTGARDDLQQRRFLEAHQEHWDDSLPRFEAPRNPSSPVYDGRMVPADAIHLWTWDARPFPTFPERASLWRDGDNWRRGHWLTGRLGRAPLDGLIAALLRDHGFSDFDVSEVDAMIGGFVVSGPGTARGELEDLLRLVDVDVRAQAGVLRFRSGRRARAPRAVSGLVDEAGEALFDVRRAQDGERPAEVVIGFGDGERAYRTATAEASLADRAHPHQFVVELPIALAEEEARGLAGEVLARETADRETARFSLGPSEIEVAPGDRLRVDDLPGLWQVERIEDGAARRIEARRIGSPSLKSAMTETRFDAIETAPPVFASRPIVHLLDLPKLDRMEGAGGAMIAVAARPWMPYVAMASSSFSGHEARVEVRACASIGRLAVPLAAGREGLWDRTNEAVVDLSTGSLASLDADRVRAGENAAAVLSGNGEWEVFRFAEAGEIAPSRYRLRSLIRGVGGTGQEAASGAPAGAAFVLLDRSVRSLHLSDPEIGSRIDWRTLPAGRSLSEDAADRQTRALGKRFLRPLSPVHLRGDYDAEALHLSWIRRTRSADEGWDELDVPLGEETERYLVSLLGDTGPSYAVETTVPHLRLPVEELNARLGWIPPVLHVEVAQLGRSVGASAGPTLVRRRA